MNDAANTVFVDGWGRNIYCVYENQRIYIYSFGANGMDNQRRNDDVVVSVDVEEIFLLRSNQPMPSPDGSKRGP